MENDVHSKNADQIFNQIEKDLHLVDKSLLDWNVNYFKGHPSTGPFYHKPNHAIAGNPMRKSKDIELRILPHRKHRPENLSLFEYYTFSFLNKISRLLRF